jgi:hypothetical protein
MAYSHFEHRHKFAAWCAARAVQRKFAKTIVLKAALERCGVVEFIKRNLGTPYLMISLIRPGDFGVKFFVLEFSNKTSAKAYRSWLFPTFRTELN